MRIRALAVFAGTLACTGGTVAVVQAASAPTPKSSSGHAATVVATGLSTPTSLAVDGGTVFEGDGGTEGNGPPNGGVFVLKGGTATKLAGSPAFVAGVLWHKGSLYVSGGNPTSATAGTFLIQKWTGFNGTSFASHKTIYTAPKKFQGLNGLGIGPDGRLYVGADVGLLNGNDHGPSTKSPYVYDILSMTTAGKGFKVYATGIRQPWQMVFPAGSKYPIVSDLGQDSGAKNAPDFLLKVKGGDNYGFPKCNRLKPAACSGDAKPWLTLAPHTDPMGLAIIGKTLYVDSFLGLGGKGPGAILSTPLSGHGKVKPAVTGFAGPTIALTTDGKKLYIGQAGNKAGQGVVYSVTP
jgi:glucose/arabinose dehydrogenase